MSHCSPSPVAEGRTNPVPERRGRSRPRFLVLALVFVCLLGVGVAWFVRDFSEPLCKGMRHDGRVEKALGNRYDKGMTCADLGAAVKAVTLGKQPGEHSLRQAQAMKDVVLAVADGLDEDGGGLDQGLRLPLAEVLADYRVDLRENLGLTPVDYVRNGIASKPAWEDDAGVHVSVNWRTALLPVVRAVSEDPDAYAVVREAVTRQAAEALAAMKPDGTGNTLSAPAAHSAWALGNLDGVAADVVSSLKSDRGREWQAAALADLSRTGEGEKTAVPAFAEAAADYLVARWRGDVAAEGAEALERQAASMFGEWCDAVGVTGTDREEAAERIERGQRAAGRGVLMDLD